MTKTLTKQWREGELDGNLYYFKLPNGNITITSVWGIVDSVWKDKEDRIEVLAPVPSYYEIKRLVSNSDESPTEHVLNLQKMVEDECSRRCKLEEQLRIATKALKDIKVRSQRDWNEYDCMECARKALYDIEMKGVK